MSGVEDSYCWVTLGFSSQLNAHDVLHIVCATVASPQDRESGKADLYLERFDQAYSCDGGATQITVTRSSVQVRLNKKGCEALCFQGTVWFDVPKSLRNYAKALRTFQKMTAQELGVDIR
jgi:hypothetical protein